LNTPGKAITEDSVSTPREFIEWAMDRFGESGIFYGHGTDNALDEAAFLVLRTLGLGFDADEKQLDQTLNQSQRKLLLAQIEERIKTRKPAAYLLGEAWFAGLKFHVNEHVLVPRSPLAELIEEQFQPWCNPEQINTVLDIGTGCGCIAIATAKFLPSAKVDAVDISAEALSVARKNVKYHDLCERVSLIEGDVFSELGGKTYDLIIANPPYVDDQDMATLAEEYRHEPALGLYAGHDGLDIVHRLLGNAAYHLNAGGVLIVEVGNSQYALEEAYPDMPFLWLDFEHGGEGVFLLERKDLLSLSDEQ
jgi:ribosomal protein L3 glutamine methyltransferase